MAVCPILDAMQNGLHSHAPVIVRHATLRDAAEVVDFKREISVADGVERLFDADLDDWARDGIGPGARFVTLVAELSASVVGMATFNEQPFAGMTSPAIYLQDIFVRPEHRRRGIGHALLMRVAAEAQSRGASLVYLNVRADNPARRLYDRLNFAQAQNCLVYVLIGPALDKLTKLPTIGP